MTIKLLEKKILITLDSDKIFPHKVANFTEHSKIFNEILPDLVQESNQKIAGRHLKATFLETDTLSAYDPMAKWRNREFNRLIDFISVPDNKTALTKFNALEDKFDQIPNISKIKEEILASASDVKESFLISKQYWGKLETHDFFSEIIARIAALFSNWSSTDLVFLSYFISMDEHGVLFLFQKFFYCCLKCKLASQLIIALYKPGQFISFFNRVAKLLWWKLDALKSSIPFIITKNTAIKVVGLSGVSFGLALFNNIYCKPMSLGQQTVLYTGFSGDLGFVFNNFRHYGSKLIFELAQTLSHISNAGIAGFIVPKEEFIKNYIKNILK